MITLEEAKKNTQQDYDPAVIDEFRKESVILDTLVFDDVVNPAGGGATLDYGYRRLVTQPTAATRELGTEYETQNVTTQKFSTTLAVLGGSYQIDRVIAKLGPAASGAVQLNLAQKIKATKTQFQDLVINGDLAVDKNAFDGLDKALIGSSTEFTPAGVDWTDLDTDTRAAFKALDLLDEFLALLDGAPTVIVGNKAALARIRAIARRSGQYTKDPIEDLIGPNKRPIVRETYGGVMFADAGEKAGSNDPIVPVDAVTGTTDLYAYRVGLDGFKGVSTAGGQLVQSWLPDFTTQGAVKKGEVELGPVGVALMATRAAAVFRGIKVR